MIYKYFITCSILLLFISFSEISAGSNLCNDPIKAICVNTKPQREKRQNYINKLKEEIKKEAYINALSKLGGVKDFDPNLSSITQKDYFEEKIINQEIMKVAKTKVKDLEAIIINPENIILIKNNILQALNESSFDEIIKDYFKWSLRSITILTYSDYLEIMGIESEFAKQDINPCGPDGMEENAVAQTFRGKNYILICPGTLITLSQVPNEHEKLSTIIQVLSHELAHFIDNRSLLGIKAYESYMTCIEENYKDAFNKSDADKIFCDKAETSEAACISRVVWSHVAEMIADQWALKALAVHARNKQLSIPEVESFLTHGWLYLCEARDGGFHPSGDFRIETLLRTNPEISEYLSCNNSSVKKTICSFEGAVNL